jgi:hypothetical protein
MSQCKTSSENIDQELKNVLALHLRCLPPGSTCRSRPADVGAVVILQGRNVPGLAQGRAQLLLALDEQLVYCALEIVQRLALHVCQ